MVLAMLALPDVGLVAQVCHKTLARKLPATQATGKRYKEWELEQQLASLR